MRDSNVANAAKESAQAKFSHGLQDFCAASSASRTQYVTRLRNQLESGPLRAEPQCLPLGFATSATPRLPSNGSGFDPVSANAESSESGVRQEDAEKANRRYEMREMLPASQERHKHG